MSRRPIDTSQLGPITCLPDAADELAKAVDAIQEAEGALARAQGMVTDEAQLAAIVRERHGIAKHRQRILAIRGGPKAEPEHFVPGIWHP